MAELLVAASPDVGIRDGLPCARSLRVHEWLRRSHVQENQRPVHGAVCSPFEGQDPDPCARVLSAFRNRRSVDHQDDGVAFVNPRSTKTRAFPVPDRIRSTRPMRMSWSPT